MFMKDKHPQPTNVLTERLQRVAKWFDRESENPVDSSQIRVALTARANTCWQSAARLGQLGALLSELRAEHHQCLVNGDSDNRCNRCQRIDATL